MAEDEQKESDLWSTPPGLTEKQASKFWSRVDKQDGCWEWQGYIRKNGYGAFNPVGSTSPILSHRLAYMLSIGPIPDGLVICHHCDNRRCCRPDHLFVGTRAENNHDMQRKGRCASGDNNGLRRHPERNPMFLYPEKAAMMRGENNGNSKLSWPQVEAIRKQFSEGRTKIAIAREFSVSHRTVRSIIGGETWK